MELHYYKERDKKIYEKSIVINIRSIGYIHLLKSMEKNPANLIQSINCFKFLYYEIQHFLIENRKQNPKILY